MPFNRQSVIGNQHSNTTAMHDFKRILVHADTMAANPAAERAAALARHVGADLTIVDVASTLPKHAARLLPEALRARVVPDRAARLAALAAELEAGPARGVRISTVVLTGKPAIAIVREAMRGGYDVLLKSHAQPGDDANRARFDAIDMQLLRKCPCPVWLVGAQPPKNGRVLAAIDPNPDDPIEQTLNRRIVEMALYLVEAEYRELVILNVWDAFGESLLSPLASDAEVDVYVEAAHEAARHDLDECLAPFGDRLDKAIVRLERGEPGPLIPAFAAAEAVDLVVMGSVARTGIAGLVMGNTAERILGSLACSVITVKPEGFVSPVALDD